MHAYLDTAGERLAIECSLPWVMELIAEGASGELTGVRGGGRGTHHAGRGGSTALRHARVGSARARSLATGGRARHRERLHGGLRPAPPLHTRASSVHVSLASARTRPGSSSDLAVAIPSSCKGDPHSISRPLVGRDAGPSSAARVGVRGRSRDAAHNCSEWDRSFHTRSRRAAGGRAGDRRQPWRRRWINSLGATRAAQGRGRETDAGCRMGATRSRSRTASKRSCPTASSSSSEDTPTTPPSPLAVPKPQRAPWLRARTWPASYGGTGLSRRCLRRPPGLARLIRRVLEVAAAFAGRLPCFSLALGRGSDSRLSELLPAVEVAA